MSNKAILVLRVVAQLLANTAIIVLIPEPYKSLAGALAVAIGVILATLDPTTTLNNMGWSRGEYLGAVARKEVDK